MSVVNKYRDYESNTQKAKAAKAEGAPWKIVHITSLKQAMELGSGSKWCISARENNQYFHYRYEEEECFYFLIKGMKKFILAFLPEMTTKDGKYLYKITDQNDKEIERGKDYNKSPILTQWGLNEKEFPYIGKLNEVELYEYEKWMLIKMDEIIKDNQRDKSNFSAQIEEIYSNCLDSFYENYEDEFNKDYQDEEDDKLNDSEREQMIHNFTVDFIDFFKRTLVEELAQDLTELCMQFDSFFKKLNIIISRVRKEFVFRLERNL